MKSMIALLFSFLALVQLALSVPAVDVDGRVAALEQHVKMLTLAQKLKALEEEAVDEKVTRSLLARCHTRDRYARPLRHRPAATR